MSAPSLGPERELLAGPLAAAGIDPGTAYLVGGSVRDALLGRPTIDLDLIVRDDPAAASGVLVRALGGVLFALSERHGAWRVVLERPAPRVIDVSPITGGSLEADLHRRDFTVNALAVRLTDGGLVDVVDGLDALRERRLTAVSASSFTADPLRLVRLARFVAELGFAVDDEAMTLATDAAGLVDGSAGERVAIELFRVLAGDAAAGLAVLDRTGVGTRLVPGRTEPLARAAGTIAALGRAADPLGELEPELGRHLDGATDVRAALRLGALLLDGGAPAAVAERLRLSRSARNVVLRAVAAVAGGPPPPDPEALLRWLRAAEPAGVAALALAIARDPSLADRAAVAARLLAPGRPLVTGRDLRDDLGLTPGPRLGAILREIVDEQALGRVATREEALEAARRLVRGAGTGPGG